MNNKFAKSIFVCSLFVFTMVVTTSCGETGSEQTVQKEEKKLQSFYSSGQLAKTSYFDNERFDPTGLTFFANFSNGENSINVTDKVVYSPSILTSGTTEVIASYTYEGITKENKITGLTVSPVEPNKLVSVGTLQKSTYKLGEIFDATGLKFMLNYTSGKSVDVTDKVRYKKSPLTLSDTQIAVTYSASNKNYICYVNIIVVNELVSLTKTGSLKKSTYYVGQKFDPTGLMFTATYADGSYKDVSDKMVYSASVLDSSIVSITASYSEGDVTKTIVISDFTVLDVEFTSLTYTGSLTKTYYYEGEDFSIDGLTFFAHFNDGHSEDVTDSVLITPTKVSYGVNKITAVLVINGISKTCTIEGFTVDNPFDYIEKITFNNGSVKTSDDFKYVSYFNENDEELLRVNSSSPILSSAEISNDKEGYLSDRASSFKFQKINNGTANFLISKDFYDSLPDSGLSFDLYSSIAINSNNTKNLTDGNGNTIYEFGHTHPSNKWMTYSIKKNRISANGSNASFYKFLILNGSTSGTYYIDNIRPNTKEQFINSGTFYFGKNNDVVLDRSDTSKYVGEVFLDNELLDKSLYEVDSSKFTLKNITNGEHELTYTKKLNGYSAETIHLYFACYKATEIISKSLSLNYGDGNYTTIENVGNRINKVSYNNKAISFEQTGSNIIIPNAQIVECLNSDGQVSSGEVSLILIGGEFNSICKEIKLSVTVSNTTAYSSRDYHTDENYHTFGYSSTSGGTDYVDSQSDDMFMEFSRSGLENVYEQASNIPSKNPLTLSDFYGGSANRVRLDLEQCEKLGLNCYLIDGYIRNLINLSGQPELIGEGCTFSSFDNMVDVFYSRVNVYKVFKSLKKIVICDEPRYYNLVAVGQVYRALEEALNRAGRSDIEIDANLLPLSAGWDTPSGLGTVSGTFASHVRNYPKRTAIYKNYLTTFLNETGANYISYDAYPLWDGSTTSSTYSNSVDEHAYSNLIVAAEFAKENNVELHVVTESFTATNRNSGKNRRVMSRNDLHWLCNQLMGFGVTRVSFFTYYSRAINSTEFNINGDKNNSVGCFKQERYDENNNVISSEKTSVWYDAQGMLEEMNEFKDVALNFKYETTNMITGLSITKKQDNPSHPTGAGSGYSYPIEWAEMVDNDKFTVGPLTGISVNKEYCFTSTLKDKDGNVMYMIQNSCDPKINSLQTDTLTFKEGNYAVIYENGAKRFVDIVNGKLTVKLSPGNAAFIMVY